MLWTADDAVMEMWLHVFPPLRHVCHASTSYTLVLKGWSRWRRVMLVDVGVWRIVVGGDGGGGGVVLVVVVVVVVAMGVCL